MNINYPRLFEISEGFFPFPTPVSLRGTSTFSCGFYLLAVICTHHLQLFDIYVVFLHLVSTSFTVASSGCGLRKHTYTFTASRLSAVVRQTLFMCNGLDCNKWQAVLFLPSPHLLPTIPPPVHFPIFSSSLTHIRYQYTLWLYIVFGGANTWLT